MLNKKMILNLGIEPSDKGNSVVVLNIVESTNKVYGLMKIIEDLKARAVLNVRGGDKPINKDEMIGLIIEAASLEKMCRKAYQKRHENDPVPCD